MIPKANSYPVFEANQVLTKAHLNQMLTYLDEQTRLSRANLIGVGIACGLEVTWDEPSSTISISKGVGITTEGYLAHIGVVGNETGNCTPIAISDFSADRFKKYTMTESMVYAKFHKDCDPVKNKTHFDLWQLIPNGAADYDTATQLDADFLKDKVALLHIELNNDALKNCSPNSCDDKGSQTVFTIRPLLISLEDAKKLDVKLAGLDTLPNLPKRLGLPDLRMPRLNVPNTDMVEARQIFDNYRDLLTGGSETMFQKVAKALALAFEVFKPVVESVAPGYNFSNKIQVLENQFRNLFDFAFFGQKKPPVFYAQYYYDLLCDLIQAYDEFRWKGVELMRLCCPHESMFPRHLLLGEVMSDRTDNLRVWRHYFRPSMAVASAETSAEEVRHLFERIILMIDKFRLTSRAPEGIRITPSRFGDVPLSQKAIPYYFVDDEGETPLHQRWDFKKTRTGRATQNLSYFAFNYGEDDFVKNPLGFDLEPYNFFRIEGHIGRSWTEVLKTLMTAIKNFRLPFDVVVLNADNFAVEDKDNPWKNRCIDNDLDIIQRIWANEVQCLYQQKIGALTQDKLTGIRSSAIGTSTKRAGATATSTSRSSRAFGIGSSGLMASAFGGATAVAQPTTILSFQPSLFSASSVAAAAFVPSSSPIFSNVNPSSSPIGNSILTNIDKVEVNSPEKLKTEVSRQLASSKDYAALSVKEYKVVAEHKVSVVADMLAVSEELAKPTKRLDYQILGKKFEVLDKSIRDYVDDLMIYNPNDKDSTLTEAEVQALIKELQALQSSCLKKRLDELKREMDLKKKAVDELIWFSRYMTNHPELQHKAGVPVGGTFVLVFRETPGDPIVNQAIEGLRKRQGYEIPEGKVLADFFIPNRCCSDCPPVKFILPPSRPVFTVTLGCPDENDVVFATIEVTHGIAPFEISVDGSDYDLFNGGVELAPGDHTLIIRDSEGGESLKKKVTTGFRMKLTAENFDCDANDEFFVARIRIENGQPPFTLDGADIQHEDGTGEDEGVFFINTPQLASGQPVTITVGDSGGCNPVSLEITHVCEAPVIVTQPNEGETEFGTPITLDVVSDDQGDNLALTAVRLIDPTMGQVAITADGRLFYAPSAVAVGEAVVVEYEVTDANGTTATSTATIKVSKKECGLPGDGKAVSCLYRMWLQPPTNDDVYKAVEVKVNKLVVNGGNDLTSKVPAFPNDEAQLTPNLFHQTMKEWVEKLNDTVQAAVPAEQKDWWKISYESGFGSYALLRIEYFTALDFSLSAVGAYRLSNSQTDFNVNLSPSDGSKYSEARLNLKSSFTLPQFDCIDFDKCNNTSEPRCKQGQPEVQIKNNGVSRQGGQRVVSLEGIDVKGNVSQWFWDMGQGISTNANDRLTAVTYKNNQANLQTVRLFGFTKAGCFAMATITIDLDAVGPRGGGAFNINRLNIGNSGTNIFGR